MRFHFEAVTLTADGDEPAWVARIVFDLFAQPANVHVERARISQIVRIPDFLHQRFARNDFAAVLHKELEQIELFGGEPLDAIPATHAPPFHVEQEVGHAQLARRPGIKRAAHALHQFLGSGRFRQNQVGEPHGIGLGRVGGERDQDRARLGAQ